MSEIKVSCNFPSLTSQVRPNKDKQASVGFRDPSEAQAIENSWFVLYCPVGWGARGREFRFWRVVSVALVCSVASWTW
jgi:hypothetical protein